MGQRQAGRLVVAIDGPSGSGKSSVSREVARALGVGYLDTGAMYRAVTWACLQDGVDLDDTDAVARLAGQIDLRVSLDPEHPGIAVGDIDVSQQIRGDAVTGAVSRVATNLAVRAELRDRQRALIAASVGDHGGVVAEGRDITTVVAPDAEVRILLTARQSARLARRARQLTGVADEAAMAAQRANVVARDAADSTVSQFVSAADGVVTLDTSELDFEESVAAVLRVVRSGRG